MNRRLGKLQQAVLEYLGRQGRYVPALELAWGIFNLGKSDPEPVPDCFHASVRRAAQSLVRKGLVRCGEPAHDLTTDYRFRGPDWRMAYWLPEHKSPRLLERRFCRAKAEACILAYLSGLTQSEINNSWEYTPQRCQHLAESRHPQDVLYSSLVSAVIRQFRVGRWYEDYLHPVIHRAVYSLLSKGLVHITCYAYRRIGAVRLLERNLDAALQAIKLTPQHLHRAGDAGSLPPSPEGAPPAAAAD